MFSVARREHFLMFNIILNVLTTIYGTTRIQDRENISLTEKACKEGHPDWHDKETTLYCLNNNEYKTCEGNCGNNIAYSTGQCFCDRDCIHYGDCCSDLTKFCPSIPMHKSNVLDLNKSERKNYECMAINETTFVYLLSSCDMSHYGSSLENSCKRDHDEDDEIMSQIPAVDPETGTVYKNIDCARCNNVKIPKLWAIKTTCEQKVLTEKNINNLDMNFIKKILTSRSCLSRFTAPDNATVRSCVPTEYTCPSCTNETLVNLCTTSGFYPLQAPTEELIPKPGIVYHNKFCWFCNNPTEPNLWSCRISISHRDRVPVERFSFQILVDMSDNKRNLNVRPSKRLQRVDFELECTAESNCVAVACPDGYTKNSEKCVMTGKLAQTILTVTVTMKVWIAQLHVIQSLQELLQQSFKPTGYIDFDYDSVDSDGRYKIIMEFNVSFPEHFPNVRVEWNMTEKYERFLNLKVNHTEFTFEANMTYKILPSESVNPQTSRATCGSICPQFITTISIQLYIFIIPTVMPFYL